MPRRSGRVTGPTRSERVAEIQQVWTEGDDRRIAALFAPVGERSAAGRTLAAFPCRVTGTCSGNRGT